MEKAIDIDSQRELLLDDYLFESVEMLSFKLLSPKPAEKVLDFDANWEGRFLPREVQ